MINEQGRVIFWGKDLTSLQTAVFIGFFPAIVVPFLACTDLGKVLFPSDKLVKMGEVQWVKIVRGKTVTQEQAERYYATGEPSKEMAGHSEAFLLGWVGGIAVNFATWYLIPYMILSSIELGTCLFYPVYKDDVYYEDEE
jgi:hypothetical protein